MFTKLSLLPFLLISFFSINIQAGVLDEIQTNIRFQKLPNSDKLSNLVINDIAQDQQGFIWIATADGLNRYDGISNKIYRPIKNHNNSLSHANITCLMIGNDGELWVGTENGLNKYNKTLDIFTQVGNTSDTKLKLTGSSIQSIFQDSKNRIWVAFSDGQVNLVTSDLNSVTLLSLSEKNPIDGNLYVRDFIETTDNKILLATNIGILKFNSQLNQLEHFQNIEKSALVLDKNIIRFFESSDNQLLISTTKGLYSLNLETLDYVPVQPATLGSEYINDMIQISDDEILVATQSSGLYLISLKSPFFKHFEKSSNKYGLIDNQLFSLFKSRDNLIWVGTNLGLNLFDAAHDKINHINSQKNYPECFAGNAVYSVLSDKQNNIWVASFGVGLFKIDNNNNICTKFQSISDLSNDALLKDIVALYEDEIGNIWIGSYDKGIVRYFPDKDKFEAFNPNEFSDDKLSLNYITAIKGDNKGKVWITTQTRGFFEFEINKQKIIRHVPFLKDSPEIRIVAINGVEIDQTGTVWLASVTQGLWTFNQQSKEYNRVTNPDLPQSFFSIIQDKENNLWLGSQNNGAFQLSKDKNIINHYSTENGLLNNVVMNIQQDNQGNMWFMTDKGLSRLSATTNKIYTFLEKDGLQADAFTTAGFFDKKSNTLWTGGINGFNYFNPDEIKIDTNVNKPIISSFELFYKPVEISNSNQITPLKQVIHQTRQLDLKHNQNVFAFTFSALEFLSPDQIQYQFKLEGYDSDWNKVSADRRYANYTNIDPGDYIFKVKASNKFGEWNDQETSIKINIAYPWWQTNLAYITYFVLMILSIYLIVTFRTKALYQRSKQLEESVAERTRELATEKQNLSVEKNKVEQLLSRKNEEFANVSHEFRTPLTLILGPLTQLIKGADKPEDLNRLNVVQRNGYRLLRMVDQLLNLETFRVKAITQKVPQATGKTIRLLTEAFADLAEEKNIKMFIKEIAEVNFEFTPDALEKIVLNLLSNAIKYTRSGGSITVATIRTKNNELRIQVEDTGIGIPADKLDSVFERYNRVLDENSEQVTGAGIGLALVKSLVESHQGFIEIKSELGKGTTILVTLPIIGEVESAQVKQHNNDEIIAMELMSLTIQNSNPDQMSDTTSTSNLTDRPVVLVIEDNQDMRNYIVESIHDEYQILTAKDGEEGLKIATLEIPDLIISDVMMPKMDGYETTHQLRENPLTNHIPIILLTARGDRESRLKGWFNKADEYLTKPFDSTELKIRLANLLEIRNILKKRFAETAFAIDSNLVESMTIESKIIDSNVIESVDQQQNTEETNRNIPQEKFVTKLNQMLEQIYTEANISVADLAFKINMSERQLFRKLKSILDMTPAEYLKRFRLEKAKVLLSQGHNVSYATFEVGFSNQSNFAKCFKALYGVSPSEYKKNHS